MGPTDDYAVFLSVYEQGSLTAAARHLGRSLQSVSRALMALERDVGVELIRRTTRQCAVTEAGSAFYQRVKPAFAEIQEAKLEAANRRVEPSGLLRIGASVQFAPAYLVPVVAAFARRHPKIEIELALSDSFVDLVDRNLDLALRIGQLPDSDLKARHLGALRRVVFGSPGYFRKHGRPKHPDDLTEHQCVLRNAGDSDSKWPFLVSGKPRSIKVGGRFRANSTAAVMSAVAEGLGIGFTPFWQVRTLIDAGTVEPVLVAYEAPTVPIHAVWPGSRFPPAKTRQFIDFLAARLKKELA